MRNDMAPFTVARVRQEITLSLDGPGMVAALFRRLGADCDEVARLVLL
jgi:hypothetical protein